MKKDRELILTAEGSLVVKCSRFQAKELQERHLVIATKRRRMWLAIADPGQIKAVLHGRCAASVFSAADSKTWERLPRRYEHRQDRAAAYDPVVRTDTT